jgi:hypothetical protein
MIPYSYASLQNYSYYSQDFRFNAGSSLFRVMRILCQFANETITNALTVFNDTQFISNEPLSAAIFDAQAFSLIAEFEQQVRHNILEKFFIKFLYLDIRIFSFFIFIGSFNNRR